MNYIYLIRGWMQVMREDDRTKTQHVALYMTLFQEWNANYFRNPVAIKRADIMQQARIGTANFYIKTIKELDEWGYIRYEPSYDPRLGSRVHLHVFNTGGSDDSIRLDDDNGGDNGNDKSDNNGHSNGADTGDDKGRSKGTDTGGDNGRETLYKTNTNTTNNLNSINSINAYGTTNENSNFGNDRRTDTHAQATDSGNHLRKKETSGGGGAGRGHDIPTSVHEAQEYFLTQHSTADEAEKFCNHYQANGWLVGGRTPMQDWQAAARNWIKNAKKFAHENRKNQPKPGPLDNGPKNYAEPY